VANGTVCCDRTALRTDVYVLREDVRSQTADQHSPTGPFFSRFISTHNKSAGQKHMD
jgi:hypothetical protein